MLPYLYHRRENKQKGHSSRTVEVSVSTHVALRMFIMQVLASRLHFLANRNTELPGPLILWPVNCVKMRGHVALVSGPTVYSLSCACTLLHCNTPCNGNVHIYTVVLALNNLLFQLFDFLCQRLRLKPEDVRLWNMADEVS